MSRKGKILRKKCNENLTKTTVLPVVFGFPLISENFYEKEIFEISTITFFYLLNCSINKIDISRNLRN